MSQSVIAWFCPGIIVVLVMVVIFVCLVQAEPAELVGAGDEGLQIRVGNSHAAGWIKENALEILEEAVNSKIEIIW